MHLIEAFPELIISTHLHPVQVWLKTLQEDKEELAGGFSESLTGETASKASLCWTEKTSHVKANDRTVSKTKDIKLL